MKIAVIDYGAGNVQSVKYALNRLGYESFLSDDAEKISSADKVIFPGVGEAASAMKAIKAKKLEQVIPELKQPVLGICLGMQLMCNYSEEGNTQGLGIFDLTVKRFETDLKVPQIGWNQIEDLRSPLFKNISENEYMYLVHSYYVPINENTIAKTNYGIAYASAIQKDNFYGVQFHPEKSSKAGEILLKNFLEL
ncbi:MAG: imidazole glycerol phosphate synthase subunit HisH [Flavobacteriia bacterium]|nr:MAG: imidazole glycerol phosphate synthase subunit HisH [Flavobacteriia bacterium]